MRMLAQAGVLVGFSGGGGTPLIAGCEIEWLNPQSEYRPTEYVQSWLSFWFDDNKRLHVAKQLQKWRIEYLQKVWYKDKDLQNEGFSINETLLADFKEKISYANSVNKLLTNEMLLTKTLYKQVAHTTKIKNFTRQHNSNGHCQ